MPARTPRQRARRRQEPTPFSARCRNRSEQHGVEASPTCGKLLGSLALTQDDRRLRPKEAAGTSDPSRDAPHACDPRVRANPARLAEIDRKRSSNARFSGGREKRCALIRSCGKRRRDRIAPMIVFVETCHESGVHPHAGQPERVAAGIPAPPAPRRSRRTPRRSRKSCGCRRTNAAPLRRSHTPRWGLI